MWIIDAQLLVLLNFMCEFVKFVTIKVLHVCVIRLIAKILNKLLFINKNLDIYDLIWFLKENWKQKEE